MLAKAWIIFPGGLFVAFYFGIACNIRFGIACGILVMLCSEVVLGRSFTGILLFVPLFFYLRYFERFGDRTSTINHALGGLLMATMNAGFYLFFENLHFRHGWSLLSGPRAFGLFGAAAAGGLIATPILVLAIDFVAAYVCVPRFQIQTGRFLQR